MQLGSWLLRWLAPLAMSVAALPATAQKSADTLRIAWRDAIPNVVPYYNNLRTGLALSFQAWDTLVYRDPETFQIKPLLATSWKQTDDTTWEFELRPNVVFHDGSRFSADDVVFTVNNALRGQVAVPSNFAYLAGAERIDDLHVRLHLKRVFPAALEYLAVVLPILPQAAFERMGADAFSKAPLGTGPYRISKVDGTTQIELERFDGYFDGPKGHPAIARVQIHEVPDPTTEVTELLAGRADWIWQFNPDQFDNISRVPALQALRAESMRIGYVQLDAAGRTGPDNPLTKVKVRQAIAYAIDRAAMAKLVGGGSRVLEAACYPTQFGCDQNVGRRYEYDPATAKRLLAEAGYPDGFDTDLVSYVLPQYTSAVGGFLKAVGINARLSQLPAAAAVARVSDGSAPTNMGSWGSYSINDVSAILPYFFDGGPSDYARDPALEKLVRDGGSSTNPDQRRKAYTTALRLISDEMYWLPLTTYVTTYGFSRQLSFRPFPDEIPRFYLSSWK